MKIRELPLVLLKHFGIEREAIAEELPYARRKRQALTNSGRYGTFLVAIDGLYPELEKHFQLFLNRDDREKGERALLEIKIIGQVIEADREKGDIYQDQVFFGGLDSQRMTAGNCGVLELSSGIVVFASQIVRQHDFEYPKYRVKHEANQPIIFPL